MNHLFEDSLFSRQNHSDDNISNQNQDNHKKKSSDNEFQSLLQSVDISNEESEYEDRTAEEYFNSNFIPYDNEYQQQKYQLDTDFLDGMNPEQREAVLYDQGSLLILAGAGSGKTRVITHRFAHLIQKYNLKIHNILCVTFTNKAAGEMKERIGDLLGVNTRTAWIRTFHSMCAMILREHSERIGYSKDFTIYDTGDTKNSIKKIIEQLKVDPKEFSDKAIARVISSKKEELISPEELEKQARGTFDHLCAEVYKIYQQTLKQNQAMDFGDLIINTILLLEQCPDIRTRYQNQWHFIMADEFQDTNTPQYRLLSLLSRDLSNVCVVGDDDQSIYAWRGAKVENIRQFHQEFKAHIIRLERNYRSHGNILIAANAVVNSVKGRMPKTLKAEREEGAKIIFRTLEDDRSQAAYVYDEIRKQITQHSKSYKDFAVLYRTNAQSRVLEEVFTRHNIPHKIFGGQRFFDRAEIKDILSYLRIIVNPYDVEAFERAVNVPKRKVGDVGKQRIQEFGLEHQLSFIDVCLRATEINGINKQASHNLNQLGNILKELRESIDNLQPTQLIKILIESIGYEEYLKSEYGVYESEDRVKNIQELMNAVRIFEQANPHASVADYLREASLLSSIDEGEMDQDNTVSLMTIHSSKGLEFPTVFVIGLVEGVLPLGNTQTSEAIDEEKRLLYVAITRAMNQLYLTYEQRSLRYGEYISNEKSHFLDAIPDEILDKTKESEVIKNNNYYYKQHPKSSYSNSTSESGYRRYKTASKSEKISSSSVQNILNTDPISSFQTSPVKSLGELTENQEVIHTVFGKGIVEYISEAMVKIKFDKFGTQVLMGNTIANLKKIVNS